MARVLCVDASRASAMRLGVGRIVENLLHAWSRQPLPFDEVRVISPSPIGDLPADDRFVPEVLPLPGPGLLWQLTRLRAAARHADAFFAPYVLPPGLGSPSVVYNLGVYLGRHAFPGWRARARVQHLAYSARRADVVIANCPTTASDLSSAFGVNPHKIRVVAEGRDPSFRPMRADEADSVRAAAAEVLGADAPYLLFVGKAVRRRHVPELVEAFSIVADSMPELRLLLVGPDGPDGTITHLAERLGVAPRVRRVPYLDHDRLRLVYRGACGFVNLSEKDGFPTTLPEAMASGCPTVTLRGASLGALEFGDGPRDAALGGPVLEAADLRPASIAEPLLRLASDEALRSDLGARAARYAEGLPTWDRTAAEIMHRLGEVATRDGAAD